MGALDALLNGQARIETLHIAEKSPGDGEPQANITGITGNEVVNIASFVSKTSSLQCLTLRLRHMDDVSIGELANVMKRPDCSVRRLELTGNYGNSGIKIFAEALKTNNKLRTITFGCLETLNNTGARALVEVVDPFLVFETKSKSAEYNDINSSNNSLKSIFLLNRPTVSVDESLTTKLQSITTSNPRQTYEAKLWDHLKKNLSDISHMELDQKCLPRLLYFFQRHGTIDNLYCLIRGRKMSGVLFRNPSQERERLAKPMKKMENQNRRLRKLLVLERARSESLRGENFHLRNLNDQRVEMKKGCMNNSFKIVHMWNLFSALLAEPHPSTAVVSL